MNNLYSGKRQAGFLLGLLFLIITDCLAREADFFSPFGTTAWYKKRLSEKDFSYSPDPDFSLQVAPLGGNSYLLTTHWKTKTLIEKVTLNNGRFIADERFLKTNGSLRKLNEKGFVIADKNENAVWNYKDPETGIELSCSTRSGDTAFNGVQKLSTLTILKKGKGLNIKEVYIEGYGLCVLVVNGVVYTQLFGDYDIKKDMMSTLGYTDPMACLLVNDENSNFYKEKIGTLIKKCDELTARGRISTSPVREEWQKMEQQLRVLCASMKRCFQGTDYESFTKKTIAYGYTLFCGLSLSNLQQETRNEEQVLIQQAHRMRLYMLPDIDLFGSGFLKADDWVKTQLNYCRSIKGLAFSLSDSLLQHPWHLEEQEYLYALNSQTLKTTWAGHVREKMVKSNLFLQECLLAQTYDALAGKASEAYYKNSYEGKSFSFAYSGLRTLAENKDSAANEINTLPKRTEAALLTILDKTGTGPNAKATPDMLWLLMCRLTEYTRAFSYFKTALPDFSNMYSDYNLPRLKAMTKALNNADEVIDLIARYRVSNEKPETSYKALAFLALDKPDAAIRLIKEVKWGALEFFVDEVLGQKVLNYAFANKQQTVLDFFYNEINNTYNLNKTPKKQYDQEKYEQLKMLSHLTEKFGNKELADKIYDYYMAMWKYK